MSRNFRKRPLKSSSDNRSEDARQPAGYTILEELPISSQDLTRQDVILYAKQIGIDPQTEADLLWIAKEGLAAHLPFPWIPVEDQKGRIYYFNSRTKESSWDHPCDSYYRSLVEQERLKASSTTISMSGLTSLANLHFVDEELLMNSDKQSDAEKKWKETDKPESKKKESSALIKKNESDDEVESVEFELDVEAAVEELSVDNGTDEDEVTIDVTEGGKSDTKQLKEIHTINLSATEKRDSEFALNAGKDSVSLHNKSVDQSKNDKIKSDGDDADEKNKIKMQMSQSSASHTWNTKQMSGNEKPKNNDPLDEFLLEVGEEDPFADFAGDDLNVNGLFRIDNTAGVSKVGKSRQNGSAAAAGSGIKRQSKLLETVDERSERDDGGGSHESEGSRDDQGEEEEENQDRDEDDDDDENDNTENIAQLEAKFDEITSNLTAKIETLRNELRAEIRQQSNMISREIKEQVDQLDSRVTKIEEVGREAKLEITQLINNQRKNDSGNIAGNSRQFDLVQRKIESIKIEMAGKTEQEEKLTRTLQGEIRLEIDGKVNNKFRQIEDKFLELKEANQKEIKSIRNELQAAIETNKTVQQQTSRWKNDLSEALLEIEKQKKETNEKLEKVTLNLDEHTAEFQKQVRRFETLMNKEENKMKEFETRLQREMSSLILKEAEARGDGVSDRINDLNAQLARLQQQVDTILRVIDENKKDMTKIQDRLNDANHLNDGQVPVGSALDANDRLVMRIGKIEDSIHQISDTLQCIKPIIECKLTSQKGNESKQDATTDTIKILTFSDPEQHQATTDDSESTDSLLSSRSKTIPSKVKNKNKKHDKKVSNFDPSYHRCQHDRSLPNDYQLIKLPVVASSGWERQRRNQIVNIKSSSTALLNLIKKTTKRLREEALELEGLGNYHFTSDIGSSIGKDSDCDEAVIRKLRSVRVDVDEKLKRLTQVLNYSKTSDL